MEHIKTCIFDLDGVICDTAKYHFLAWKALADELGICFTKQDNERLKGVSRMDSLDILLSLSDTVWPEEQKQVFAEQKNRLYVEYISSMNQDEILPGVLPFLTYCRNNEIRTALGSVSKNAGMILERLKLGDYFDAVIDGTQVAKAKPDPEVFLKGAKQTGAEPSECIVFEDARAGIEAAGRAGMLAVGIGAEETLSNADFVISGFDVMEAQELLVTVNKIRRGDLDVFSY